MQDPWDEGWECLLKFVTNLTVVWLSQGFKSHLVFKNFSVYQMIPLEPELADERSAADP